MKEQKVQSYWGMVFQQYRRNRLGTVALIVLLLFAFVGLYAPLFSSSQPIVLVYNEKLYFPLLRYLFYTGFYTKKIDLFYNILMFILPITLIGCLVMRQRASRKCFFIFMICVQCAAFIALLFGVVKDPASSYALHLEKIEAKKQQTSIFKDALLLEEPPFRDWTFENGYKTDYGKLSALLKWRQQKIQHEKFAPIASDYAAEEGTEMPTLYAVRMRNLRREQSRLEKTIEKNKKAFDQAILDLPELLADYLPLSHAIALAKTHLEEAKKGQNTTLIKEATDAYNHAIAAARPYRLSLEKARAIQKKTLEARSKLRFIQEREAWFEKENQKITFALMPFIRPFHWEEDAGGQQSLNKYIAWYDRTRVNRKDLVAGLIFGIRISLVVGVTAVFLSLCIGIPLGTISGYFAGKVDIFLFRFIEIWEAMPTFFMLLMIVAILQSKSIFVVIAVLGIFGWTGFGRFIRGEVLKQRNLPYVLAAKNLGYKHGRIMFSEIMPNAIAPILTLLPFSMMAAITSEAGLSFLGLGEEGSTSWGVLMDEGRSVFPGESYLLWPPAIMLTLLLISIALVGDALRDALDPRLRN